MAVIVSLREVADELSALMEGFKAYLNRETGELYSVSDEDVHLLDDEDDVEVDNDDLPGWQIEMLAKTREVLESEDWLRLPTKFDIHEWTMMEEFSCSVDDANLRDELLGPIRGPGAFRYFKDTIHRRGIQDRWYEFKAAALEQIAARWLDKHGIAYARDGSDLPGAAPT